MYWLVRSSSYSQSLGLALLTLCTLCPPAGAQSPALAPQGRIPLAQIEPRERLPAQSAPAPMSDEDQERVRDAQAALASGDADRALSLARDLPFEAFETRLLLAQVEASRRLTREAYEHIQAALKLRPDSADALALLGRLRLMRGEAREAIGALRQATLQADDGVPSPAITAAWYLLGRILAAEGYLLAGLEALGQFDELIWETYPEHRVAAEVRPILEAQPRGTLDLRLGLYAQLQMGDEAARLAAWATETLPDDPAVPRLAIRALLDAGRPADALTLAERRADTPLPLLLEAAHAAGRLEPLIEKTVADGASERIERMATLLLEMNLLSQSAALLTTLHRAAPGRADFAWNLARAQFQSDPTQTRETLQTWCQGDGQPPGLTTLWAWTEVPAGASADSKPASADAAENAGYCELMAAAALRARGAEWQSAAELARRALELQPASMHAHALLGVIALRQYDWATARERGAALIELDPKLSTGHAILGLALDGLDDTEAARSTLRRAVQGTPPDLMSLLTLARSYQRAGEAVSAQRYYSEAAAAAPWSGIAIEELIDSYVADDKVSVARQRFERAQESDAPPDARRRIAMTLRHVGESGAEFLGDLQREAAANPGDVRTAIKLAATLRVLGRIDEAVAALERVQVAGAPDESLLAARALALRAALRHDDAAMALTTLLERYPNRRYVLNLLADVRMANFQPAEAREALARMLALAEDDDQRDAIEAAILRTYELFGDFAGALQELERQMAARPRADVFWALRRCSLLMRLGRVDEAMGLLGEQQQLVAAESLIEGGIELALQAGAVEAAERLAREELKKRPKDYGVSLLLARALQRRGQTREALDLILETGTNDWKQAQRRRLDLAIAQRYAGDYAAAQRELEALLRERVGGDRELQLEARAELFSTLLAARQFDQALTLVESWPGEPASVRGQEYLLQLRFRQQVYQAADRLDDYIAAGEELLQFFPGNPLYLNDLGYTLADNNRNLPRAIQMIRQAVAVDQLNPAYLDSLGWAHYKLAEFEAAARQLRRAAMLHGEAGDIGGQDPIIYDHLGDAEWRLGNKQAATAAWKKALELSAGELDPARRLQLDKVDTHTRAKLAAIEAGQAPSVSPTAAEAQ